MSYNQGARSFLSNVERYSSSDLLNPILISPAAGGREDMLSGYDGSRTGVAPRPNAGSSTFLLRATHSYILNLKRHIT